MAIEGDRRRGRRQSVRTEAMSFGGSPRGDCVEEKKNMPMGELEFIRPSAQPSLVPLLACADWNIDFRRTGSRYTPSDPRRLMGV